MNMASTCAKLCQRCRGALSCKATTGWSYVQLRHCMTTIKESTVTGPHTASQTRLWRKPKTCDYYCLTAKYLTTEAKENNYKEELYRTDIVPRKTSVISGPDVLPVTKNEVSLGRPLFNIDHKKIN